MVHPGNDELLIFNALRIPMAILNIGRFRVRSIVFHRVRLCELLSETQYPESTELSKARDLTLSL